MEFVSSSNIAAVEYNENEQILKVRFHKGGTYAYYNVPKNIYLELMAAPSKGIYHKNHIKYSFPYRRIG